jgi:hypothetical protein
MTMFETWTDVVAAGAAAFAIAYVGYEIAQRQQQLRDLFEVLDGDDAAITVRLEQMVEAGLLTRIAGEVAA